MSIKVDFEKKPEERVQACIEQTMGSLDKKPCSARKEVRSKNCESGYYVKSKINSKIRPNGKKGYPPKETLRRAWSCLYPKQGSHNTHLNGGEEANTTLMRYGFKVYCVKDDKPYKPPNN